MSRGALHRIATCAVVAALAAPWSCRHAAKTPAGVAPAVPGGEGPRAFTRVSIEPDGGIHAGENGPALARPEDIPAPEGGVVHWLLASSAPTDAAMVSLTAVADLADARGWFLMARVLPENAAPAALARAMDGEVPPSTATRSGAMLHTIVEVLGDGSVTLGGATASAAAARTLLRGEACQADEAIALRARGAEHRETFRAAGYFAAAGCSVMVLQRPAGTVPRARPGPAKTGESP